MTATLNALGMHYRDLNISIKSMLAAGDRSLSINNVNGQRYIGSGIQGQCQVLIEGVPGNDLGMFMDGPLITVHGNVQDGVANTMNNGRICIHGSAGDALGYGMRGGEVLVRDDVGYRAGIHMKGYMDQKPVLIIGGTAGNFLGEYMAGGIIIVFNRQDMHQPVGDYCGSGIHGGAIYIRRPELLPRTQMPLIPIDEQDLIMISTYARLYEAEFQQAIPALGLQDFVKLIPDGSRPYKQLYVGV